MYSTVGKRSFFQILLILVGFFDAAKAPECRRHPPGSPPSACRRCSSACGTNNWDMEIMRKYEKMKLKLIIYIGKIVGYSRVKLEVKRERTTRNASLVV